MRNLNHCFNCETSLALTYSMGRSASRRQLARECASKALIAAINDGRPDLAWEANEILSALNAGVV